MVWRWLLAAVLLPLLLAAARAADRKPNVVFVYSDDHRWDAMSIVQKEQAHAARFAWFASPNMDRLAAGGVRFRNAFVTLSLCAPSRAAYLTGRYNHANGITNNSRPFPADASTYATLLRDAGYRTAYVGKWHMGNQSGQRPGFDYSASFVGQGRYQNCPFEINGQSTPTKGYVDDVSTDYAIAWMKEHRDRPFCLTLGLKSPHGPRGPNQLPEKYRTLFADRVSKPTPNCGVPAIFHEKDPKTGQFPPGISGNAAHLDYLRHIAWVDDNLGRVLDALDELKLKDDTVIVYTSDNGYFLGEHNSGDKRALYDESLRVPFLVRYPRLFKPAQTIDEMVLNVDLAPTLLDLAGAAIPQAMQGRSWKPLAAGRPSEPWRQSFLVQYYKELGNVPTCYGLRTATHKLVKYPGHPEWTEAFDLQADPYETKNLVGDAVLVAKLDAELTRTMAAVNYTPPKATAKTAAPAIVDTHVHLWDIARPEGLGWIAPTNAVLRRSFLPQDHRPLAVAHGVARSVVVQAGQSLSDNLWNLEITASHHTHYPGVVGNLSKAIGTEAFAPLFDSLCKDSRYVGYRLSGRHSKTLNDAFFRDLERTAAAGRTLDLLIGEYTLEDALTIAQRVPKLKIMVNHFAGVKLNHAPLDADWVRQFKALGKLPNAYCKVSGFYGRATVEPVPKTAAFYAPIFDLAFEAFSEDRLVFGSDWPVSEMTANYATGLALVQELLAGKSPRTREQVLSGNAVRFYGLPAVAPAKR
jgi:arylsulfatase A-like enzyme/predicted TIM-barrel fold metal-dependent hydrolase